jgi:hypothetical protein
LRQSSAASVDPAVTVLAFGGVEDVLHPVREHDPSHRSGRDKPPGLPGRRLTLTPATSTARLPCHHRKCAGRWPAAHARQAHRWHDDGPSGLDVEYGLQVLSPTESQTTRGQCRSVPNPGSPVDVLFRRWMRDSRTHWEPYLNADNGWFVRWSGAWELGRRQSVSSRCRRSKF